jgi:alkylation response protein AidB-like acyl-CoA dehydrogenase
MHTSLGSDLLLEWDIFHFIVLHFELAKIHAGVCVGLSGSSAIGAPPIVHFGTEQQKQRFLPGILTGEINFCLGATEPTGGSDLSGLKTTAVKDASGEFYIVNGHKVSGIHVPKLASAFYLRRA